MIYQPKNIQPTHRSIDGLKNNEISMVMNTTEYVDAYKLTIYNMDNTIFMMALKLISPTIYITEKLVILVYLIH